MLSTYYDLSLLTSDGIYKMFCCLKETSGVEFKAQFSWRREPGMTSHALVIKLSAKTSDADVSVQMLKALKQSLGD